MQVEIKIDEQCLEPKIVIVTREVTDEVNEIVKSLSCDSHMRIVGFQESCAEILQQENIERVFASDGKVIAQTDTGEYVLRLRLYEAEQRLNRHSFVRISNSEIINLKKVKGFDLSFVGYVCVTLTNGTVTYVSRRYVAKIKQVLGI